MRMVFWPVIIVGAALIVFVVVRGEKLLIRSPVAYQAVFLDNDQVYFGKLRAARGDFLSLTDVYYLRAGSVQQGTNGQPEGEQSLDLVKLGAEVHAPKDEVIINKSHVIFYEDLSDGGEVMKLIRQHQAGK